MRRVEGVCVHPRGTVVLARSVTEEGAPNAPVVRQGLPVKVPTCRVSGNNIPCRIGRALHPPGGRGDQTSSDAHSLTARLTREVTASVASMFHAHNPLRMRFESAPCRYDSTSSQSAAFVLKPGWRLCTRI